MNFPPNSNINIEVLMLALSRQDEPIPEGITQAISALKDAAFHQGNPEATGQIRTLIRQHPPLETAYNSAYQYLDSQYSAQRRAKALGATFPNPDRLQWTFYNKILPSHDWVKATRAITERSSPAPFWENLDRTAIMGAGGAFLGSALAQLFGGGMLYLIGAMIGAIVGVSCGLFLLNSSNRPRRRSSHSHIDD